MWLRQGVYYLSLGGIALFGAIVVVAIRKCMHTYLQYYSTGTKNISFV